MSWLSEMFGGGGGEDPNAVIQRQQMAQAESNRQQQALAATAQQQQQEQFAAMMALLKPADPAPVDPRIQQREDLRANATGALKATFAPGFENTYIPDTYDDALGAQVYGEQRGKADEYLNRLLKRGVITDTGAQAGMKNLDEQGARVRTQLKDLGDSLIGAQRGKLTDIYGRGADAAATTDIGQSFDPSVFANLINQNVTDFNASFGDSFRAGVPGDLFDTSGLSAIAGGAQGAGNLAYDPDAVAGIGDDETDETLGKSAQKKRSATVF